MSNIPCVLQKERKQFKLSQKRMASFATSSYRLRFVSTFLVLNCGSVLISDPGHRRQSLLMHKEISNDTNAIRRYTDR